MSLEIGIVTPEPLSKLSYALFIAWLFVIYLAGSFVPLMNHDSAHHANIALHMYLTGDYVNLIEIGHDYLDKPHLLFWLVAFSYKIFGVNTFAYKFPSLVFSLLGIWSTYRLGKHLANRKAGKYAAFILATAFAFVLANNDVRMDAILTGSIIFATWQLTMFSAYLRWSNLLLGGLGLASGFATKGMIGMVMPLIAVFIHLLFNKNWKSLFHWKWLFLPFITLAFISPVLYCYYLQFDLHPGKVIRGRDHVSGVAFILWSQNVERLEGSSFGSSEKGDPFFFVHTFLWAFLPWSLLAIAAWWKKIRDIFRHHYMYNNEVLTTGTITVVFILISVSGFKLPHYLNILLPLFSILVGSYLVKASRKKELKEVFITQVIIATLMIVFAVLVNVWVFPVRSFLIVAGVLLIIGTGVFAAINSKTRNNAFIISVTAALLANFLFNTNYYPQLLSYQAGNNLAAIVKEKNIDVQSIYYLENYERSNSFDFYTAHLTPQITLDELANSKRPLHIYTGSHGLEVLTRSTVHFRKIAECNDYHVSEPKGKFLNPNRRTTQLQPHYLLEVID